jgi:cytochrome P450
VQPLHRFSGADIDGLPKPSADPKITFDERHESFSGAATVANRKCRAMPTAPGHTFWIPLPCGALRHSFKNPLEFMIGARERFGDVVRFRVGPFVTHFLFHPDHIARVLRDQQKNYLRGWQYNLLRRIFDENLVASEGAYWRRQRRLAQPAFNHQMLAEYAATMIDSTSKLLGEWQRDADRNAIIEVAPAMSRLALEIAGRTLFGQDVASVAGKVASTFGTLAQYLESRFMHPLTSLPASWPTPANRRFRRAKQELTDVVLSLIHRHRSDAANHRDLLAMLIRTRDEDTGEQMTDGQLTTEALTFLIAGHETTARGLTWTLYLLATHPEVRKRLQAEVDSVLDGDSPSPEVLSRLVATRMAVEESLRLYPPVWALTREAVAEDEIGGFCIPAKSMIVLSPYVTQRHPKFWPEPDVFDIDRFTSELESDRPKGAYFPFIFGPHQCIGVDFAMQELCLVVAMIVRRFDFELQPGQTIHPVTALALNPSGPVRITLRRRERMLSHG